MNVGVHWQLFENFSICIYFFLSALALQVYLGRDTQAQVYANATIQPSSPINADLLLDQSEANIYVMTRNTVCTHKTNNVEPLNATRRIMPCAQTATIVFARQHFHSKPWPRCLRPGRLSFSGRAIYVSVGGLLSS